MPQKTPDFSFVTSALGYADAEGFLPVSAQPASGTRRQLLKRADEQVHVDAVHFGGDRPLVYFADRPNASDAEIRDLQKAVWNDSRVPLLIVVRRNHVAVYDGYHIPPQDADGVNADRRLIRSLELTARTLESLSAFDRRLVETGETWKRFPKQFDPRGRCDQNLLKNLRFARKELLTRGLSDHVIHLLLPRLILILYLDHRKVLQRSFYRQFNADDLFGVLRSKRSAYALFRELETKFNGDLFPVSSREELQVDDTHLNTLAELLSGTTMETGQRSLWPLYDFSIIPIQLVSAIYEFFLRTTTDAVGAVYTPIELVELLLNEVLPWPSATAGAELPRVVDPACGSGIFLVEAYKRLVATWRVQNPGERPAAGILKRLLVEHIFGIEEQQSAAHVAAFSLYLAMLDHLEPPHIWRSVRFPSLTTSETERAPNIQIGDAFTVKRPQDAFDLVVGNPPWKRNYLPDSASQYCEMRSYPVAKEIAQAFMWRARDLAKPNGRVAIFTTAKWLFNREAPDREFRRAFLRRNYIEIVVNLAVLRRSGLFAKAVGPAVGVVFRPERPPEPSETVLYCTPKPYRRRNVVRFVIDASDVKWIPRDEAENTDDVWKIMLWASNRDLQLIRRLTKGQALSDFIKANGWQVGRGFQPYVAERNMSRDPQTLKPCPEVGRLPFVDAEDVTRYGLARTAFQSPFQALKFVRCGRVQAYSGPHVVVKEGLSQNRFTAAYTSRDCTFRDTITGIVGQDPGQLKALTVYLNSKLATYFLFLTVTTWGVERERIKTLEFRTLPARPLDHAEITEQLAVLYDRLNAQIEDPIGLREAEVETDSAIYRSFGLTASDMILVEDLLQFSIGSAATQQEGDKRPTSQHLTDYARTYAEAVRAFLPTNRHLQATVRDGNRTPLLVLSFVMSNGGGRATDIVRSKDLDHVLERLDKALVAERSDSVYFRRHLHFYEGETLHIVKPAERRFWTRSAALTDADHTLGEVLSRSLIVTQ